MIGKIASLMVVVGLFAVVGQTQAPPHGIQDDSLRIKANPVSGASRGTGTVQYDPGAPADSFISSLPQPAYWVGNRFDTRNRIHQGDDRNVEPAVCVTMDVGRVRRNLR